MYAVFRNLTPAQRRAAYEYFLSLGLDTIANGDVPVRLLPVRQSYGPYESVVYERVCPLGAVNVTAVAAGEALDETYFMPSYDEHLVAAFGGVDDRDLEAFYGDFDAGQITDLAVAMGVEDDDAPV